MNRAWLITFLLVFSAWAEAEIHPLSLSTQTEYKSGNYNGALLSYNNLIQEFPHRKEGYFNRGLCLYSTEKFSEAVFDFETAFDIDTLLTEALLMKAFALENQGKAKEAVAQYEFLSVNHATIFPLQQRIKNYYIAVYISSKWYYMVAILLVIVILITVTVRSFSYKK